MSFRGYLIPHFPNLSVVSDPERHPDDPKEGLPEKRFHPPCAVRFDHLEVRIGEKREIQPVFGFELRLGFDSVTAATNHRRIQLVETAHRVAKLGRFVRSTRRVGLGKEVEDQVFATKIVERNRAPVVSRGMERRGPITFLEHLFVSGHIPVLRQKSAKDFIHELRIGLAARFTHHLPHEELEHTFVSSAEFGHVIGILRDHFARHLFDRTRITDLR